MGTIYRTHHLFLESILTNNFGWILELSNAGLCRANHYITAPGMFFGIIPIKSTLGTATSNDGIAQLVKLVWRFPKSWGYPQIMHFHRIFHWGTPMT